MLIRRKGRCVFAGNSVWSTSERLVVELYWRWALYKSTSFPFHSPFSPILSYPSPVGEVSRLIYLNIWRGSPPRRRTNRPTWLVPAARRPSPPLEEVARKLSKRGKLPPSYLLLYSPSPRISYTTAVLRAICFTRSDILNLCLVSNRSY